MKVVAFNGSPRKDGNTDALIRYVLASLTIEGIETEVVQLAGRKIRGCIACYKCWENRDGRCAVKNDDANAFIEKVVAAQGVLLASPSYFQDVTAEMKALIDRVGFVGLANDRMYRDKVGAVISCFRRSGGVHTIESMMHLFLSNEFVIAGRALCVARDPGDVEKDEEGILTAKNLGKRMAWVMKKLYG